jgi:hypothetical protein
MKKELESKKSTLKAINIKEIKDLDSLKLLGTFSHVKILISDEIGARIKAKSWILLFKTIRHLNKSLEDNREKLKAFISNDETSMKASGKFNDVKCELSDMLGLGITARGWSELRRKIENLLQVFSLGVLVSKYDLYEKIKRSNFVASSKLEGIEVSDTPSSKSMADVINKYKLRS